MKVVSGNDDDETRISRRATRERKHDGRGTKRENKTGKQERN